YLGALPACELARAAERMKRVGIVGWKIISADEYWAPFYQEMQERSWIEGRNVVYERRFFDPGDVGAISAHLAELIALDVDVIHVQGAQAALAAKSASKRIPIVFYVGDAVGRGVVANLARPESNLTGISSQFVEETAKRLELLKQIAPRISRVAALYNTDLGHPTAIFGEPKPRGVAIFMVTLRAPVDLLAAMEAVSHGGADAILVAQVWPRPFNGEIVSAIARTRLPAIYLHREFIELGG